MAGKLEAEYVRRDSATATVVSDGTLVSDGNTRKSAYQWLLETSSPTPFTQPQDRYTIGIQGAMLNVADFSQGFPHCSSCDGSSELLGDRNFSLSRDIGQSTATMEMVLAKAVGNRLPQEMHDYILDDIVTTMSEEKRTCSPQLLAIDPNSEYLPDVARRLNGLILSYDPCSRESFNELVETYDTLMSLGVWSPEESPASSYTQFYSAPVAPPSILVVGLNPDYHAATRLPEVTSGQVRMFAHSIGAQLYELWTSDNWEAINRSCSTLLEEVFHAAKAEESEMRLEARREEEKATRSQVVSALAVLEPSQGRFRRLIELLSMKNVFNKAKPSKLLNTIHRIIHLKRDAEEVVVVKRQRNRLRKRSLSKISASLESDASSEPVPPMPARFVRTPVLQFEIESPEDEEWIQDVLRCINEVDLEAEYGPPPPIPAQAPVGIAF